MMARATEHDALFLPFTPDRLSSTQQRELQSIAQDVSETLAQYLGIPLDELEVFQQFLAHLNDQNSGRKDRQDSYRRAARDIIQPQFNTLVSMVQEHLHPSEWRVRAQLVPILGDMLSVTVQHVEQDCTVHFYERGVSVDTPSIEVSWNTFPADRDSTHPDAAALHTHITAFYRPTNRWPWQAIKIQAEPTVPGDGVLALIATDHGRANIKPTITELLQPSGVMTSQASYSSKGELEYLRFVVRDPQSQGHDGMFVMVYDYRAQAPATGDVPASVKQFNGSGKLELPAYPDVQVANDTVYVEFLNQRDAFPLRAGTPQDVGRNILATVQAAFPPRQPWPAIAAPQTQA